MNTPAPDRHSRLAAALRENLKRRKRQSRERVREAAPQSGGETGAAGADAREHQQQHGRADLPGGGLPPEDVKGSD